MLAMAEAGSSSDDRAIRYVLPVLRITSYFHKIRHMWCTARLTAEGCQPAGGKAERGGASALYLRPSLRCLSAPGIPRRPLASPYKAEFGCGDDQCVVAHGVVRSLLSSNALLCYVTCYDCVTSTAFFRIFN